MSALSNTFALLSVDDDDDKSDANGSDCSHQDDINASRPSTTPPSPPAAQAKPSRHRTTTRRAKGKPDERLMMGDTLLEAMDKSKGRVSERVYRLLEEVNRGIVRVFFGVASTGSFTRSSDDDDTDDMNDVDRSSNDDDEARAKTVVQQYALPPMQSYLRAIFARLADQHYQLRVKTRGDGAKRTLVLYRTARTEQVARKLQVNSVSVASTIGVNAAPTTTADAVGTSSKAATTAVLDDHAYMLQHFADRALRSALLTVAGVDVDKIEHDWIISRQKGMPVGFDAKPLDEKNVGYRMFQRMGWEKEDQSSAASASVGEKGGSSSSNSAAPRPRHAEAISVIVKDDRKGF